MNLQIKHNSLFERSLNFVVESYTRKKQWKYRVILTRLYVKRTRNSHILAHNQPHPISAPIEGILFKFWV